MFARLSVSHKLWPLPAALAAICLILTALTTASVSAQGPDPVTAGFVHVATSGNTSGNLTLFENAFSNANTSALAFVTPNWTPGGAPGTTDNHPSGVQYDGGKSQWGVAHQDLAAMPAGAGFNVLLATPGASAFTLKGFSGSDSAVMIDNPLTNNNPNALLFITPDSTPSGAAGAYNPHPAGVFYDTDGGRWWVFNQDGLAIPAQAAFNVLVRPAGSTTFVQVATQANTTAGQTSIDHALANNNPRAVLMATANWSPGGTPDPHNIGVRYDSTSQRWAIFNEDGNAIPIGAAFNVTIYTSTTYTYLPEVLKP